MSSSLYLDELVPLIDSGKVCIACSYWGGSYYKASPYIYRSMSEGDFRDALKYRAVANMDNHEFPMAYALGLTSAEPSSSDVSSDSVFVLICDDATMSCMSDELQAEIARLPIAYESSEHPELSMSKETYPGCTLATYSGEIPDNIAYFSCRERAIAAANRFWRSASVVNKDNPRKALKDLKSLKKSEHLINALLLSTASMHLTQRRGKVPDGVKGMLLRIDYLTEDLPTEVKESMKALRMFEDVAALWQYALKDADVALALTQKDLEDGDALGTRIEAISKFTLMEDFMDTYLAGVPAEDILA